jgi:hypothetical protein
MIKKSHLFWIPAGAVISFLASFIFGDRLALPVDLYYLIYFTVIFTFFWIYVRRTGLDLKSLISRRIVWGMAAGVIIGVMMVQNVYGRPATAQFSGQTLFWAIIWRGLIYGLVDGLILFAFPWIVTWRAFHGGEQGRAKKVGISLLAYLFILVITTSYHLGYSDFRSRKIIQPNIGSTIMAIPTLITANPVSSPISHVFLHVAAVIHSPETELFLPPHRDSFAGNGDMWE